MSKITREVRVEDGVEITDTFEDGNLMGTALVPLPTPDEQAAAAAEQARLDKLHKLLDASKPDPASIADVVVILKALAFGDVTKSSGDAAAAEALPVDPKGGIRV